MSLYGVPSRKIGPEPTLKRMSRRFGTTLFFTAMAALVAAVTLTIGILFDDAALSYRVESWCLAFWIYGLAFAVQLLANRRWLDGASTVIVVAIIGASVWRFAAPLLLASGILGPYIIPIES